MTRDELNKAVRLCQDLFEHLEDNNDYVKGKASFDSFDVIYSELGGGMVVVTESSSFLFNLFPQFYDYKKTDMVNAIIETICASSLNKAIIDMAENMLNSINNRFDVSQKELNLIRDQRDGLEKALTQKHEIQNRFDKILELSNNQPSSHGF